MSSESETSENPEAECKRAVTVHEQVVGAIKALGSRNGSSRDEIVDYLVSRGLMQPKIAKALVAKALYKAIDEGLVKRPGGSKLYRVSTSRRKKHRGQHHGPKKSTHGEKRRKAERRKDGKRRHKSRK